MTSNLTSVLITLRAKLCSGQCIVIAPVCVFVCGSALLQPAGSVCVASDCFFSLHFVVSGRLETDADIYIACLFVLLVFNDTFSTNRLYRIIGV